MAMPILRPGSTRGAVTCRCSWTLSTTNSPWPAVKARTPQASMEVWTKISPPPPQSVPRHTGRQLAAGRAMIAPGRNGTAFVLVVQFLRALWARGW